ncbi:hypothetical protein SJDPG12_09510 [Porphyromonas gingivalis SJD12]|nr:hypothetical protein SJDPG12_09510 [Porphyromonas gingivalis SJD12]
MQRSLYKNNAKQGGGKQMVDYPLLCPTEDEKRKGKEDEGKKKGGRKRRKEKQEKEKAIEEYAVQRSL